MHREREREIVLVLYIYIYIYIYIIHVPAGNPSDVAASCESPAFDAPNGAEIMMLYYVVLYYMILL